DQRPIVASPARARLTIAEYIHVSQPSHRPDERAPGLEYSSAPQKRCQCRSELRWARTDSYSSRLHRFDLAFGTALATGDDRAGMAHPPAGRGGSAGDEADDRLAPAPFRLVGEELRCFLF